MFLKKCFKKILSCWYRNDKRKHYNKYRINENNSGDLSIEIFHNYYFCRRVGCTAWFICWGLFNRLFGSYENVSGNGLRPFSIINTIGLLQAFCIFACS